jgi:hypothetical protein
VTALRLSSVEHHALVIMLALHGIDLISNLPQEPLLTYFRKNESSRGRHRRLQPAHGR